MPNDGSSDFVALVEMWTTKHEPEKDLHIRLGGGMDIACSKVETVFLLPSVSSPVLVVLSFAAEGWCKWQHEQSVHPGLYPVTSHHGPLRTSPLIVV